MFEGSENLTQTSLAMLKWTFQHLHTRQNLNSIVQPSTPLFNAFVFRAFEACHNPLDGRDTRLVEFMSLIEKKEKTQYQKYVLSQVSLMAQRHHVKLNNTSVLPFAYRVLMTVLSDFNLVKHMYSSYTSHPLSVMEMKKVSDIVFFFEKGVRFEVEEEDVTTIYFNLN
jgi:hypothetical protein